MKFLSFSADHGFEGVTIPFMTKLHKSLEVAEATPTRELDLVKSLYKAVRPAATDEDLNAALGRRRKKWAMVHDSILRYAPVDLVDDVFDSNDRKEFKEAA